MRRTGLRKPVLTPAVNRWTELNRYVNTSVFQLINMQLGNFVLSCATCIACACQKKEGKESKAFARDKCHSLNYGRTPLMIIHFFALL